MNLSTFSASQVVDSVSFAKVIVALPFRNDFLSLDMREPKIAGSLQAQDKLPCECTADISQRYSDYTTNTSLLSDEL